VLPTAVQHAYAEAKAAFDRKDPAATARFDVVLKLLEDPDVARTDEFDDLKVVVRGFRDLSTARAAAAVPVPAVKGGAAPAAEPVKPPSAAEKQATPPVAIPPVYRDGALDLTPPVAISQRMPTAVLPGRRLWTGAVELLIDETGGVQSARMAVPIHPAYDSQLLKAVREWKYRPATKNGVPVRYAKIISIRVDTR
jgi:TonB family protein